MLHHHLPQIVSHMAAAGRQTVAYFHAAGRAMVGSIYHLQSPRAAFRVALRQGDSRWSRSTPTIGGRRVRAAPLLIHYHIFKNAGTSFEWTLQEVFGERFRQYDSPHPGGHVRARDIARLARAEPHLCAISSHQATPPAPRLLGRHVLTSILIRDPIARIGSIYSFERKQEAETPGAVQAKKLDFKGYVEWRLQTSPAMFCNYQVHLCAGRHARSFDCGKRELEAAIIRLDAIDIVGTVQRYGEWLALAQDTLNKAYGAIALKAVHHNQSRDRPIASESDTLDRLQSDLGPQLTSELLERNELDMCLHQVADALLTRRLAECAAIITLREAYAEADNKSAGRGTVASS